MKNRKWMTLGAALAFLFTAQPGYAAPVIVAGSGNRTEAGQVPGSAAQEPVSQTPSGTSSRKRESGIGSRNTDAVSDDRIRTGAVNGIVPDCGIRGGGWNREWRCGNSISSRDCDRRCRGTGRHQE